MPVAGSIMQATDPKHVHGRTAQCTLMYRAGRIYQDWKQIQTVVTKGITAHATVPS